jgi:ribosomal protein L37AE/L43A
LRSGERIIQEKTKTINMAEEKIKLRNCPFCDSDILHHDTTVSDWVECQTCYATASFACWQKPKRVNELESELVELKEQNAIRILNRAAEHLEKTKPAWNWEMNFYTDEVIDEAIEICETVFWVET